MNRATATRANQRPSRARVLALAFGALFFVVGVAMLVGGWWPRWNEHRNHRELAARGVLALGTVVTKGREIGGSVSVLGVTQSMIDYTITFHFTTADGRPFTDHANVSAEEWALLDKGGFLKVQYLPDNPRTNRVPGEAPRLSWLATAIFSAVGALFTAIGVLIYYILLWQPTPTHQSH